MDYHSPAGHHNLSFYWSAYQRKSESESCSVMSNSLGPHELYSPRNSPGQNTRVGSLSLLLGIFPTQESNPGLPHCRRILYQVSYQGTKLPGPLGMDQMSCKVRKEHLLPRTNTAVPQNTGLSLRTSRFWGNTQKNKEPGSSHRVCSSKGHNKGKNNVHQR